MYSTRKLIIYYFLVSNSVIQHTKKEISPLARSTHDNQSFSQSVSQSAFNCHTRFLYSVVLLFFLTTFIRSQSFSEI